jgi:glycerol-3-phosphate acyltransferase PlsX
MRIAVDAMGSDDCPAPDVAGSILAARESSGDTILLVGDEQQIQAELRKHDTTGLDLKVVRAAQTITMQDKPSEVGKGKPDSSMHVGLRLVHDGEADAFVTAGNTGAALAIALLHTLKRIRGIKRPALCREIPTGSTQTVLLDIGATPDAKPDWLLQFALMGDAYARYVLGVDNPRVTLLSNGEEESKGSQPVREASDLLEQSALNYTGHIEPKDLLRGAADVVVSDGFSGNIMIKSAEAAMSFLGGKIRSEVKSNPRYMLGGLLLRPALRKIQRELDPTEIGGALLLGVNGVVIIGHGRSNATAIKNAIRQARSAVEHRMIEAIEVGLEQHAALETE